MKFHERFEIPVNLEEAKRRFLNRVSSLILREIFYREVYDTRQQIRQEVAYELGVEYNPERDLNAYIRNEFYLCLQALEAFYRVMPNSSNKVGFDETVQRILLDSEVDLGIRWEDGRFIKSGAKLLDEELVNKSLHWLSDKNFHSVLAPYSKGLEHFLQATNRPELLSDVITDMYEAVEALTKLITGRDTKDISANAQLFLKEVRASESYKNILREYISYANNFRHAVIRSDKRPNLSTSEVESFIYLTGIFIRLAIQRE